MGSSWTRSQTRVPCIGRQILNHCAPREAQEHSLKGDGLVKTRHCSTFWCLRGYYSSSQEEGPSFLLGRKKPPEVNDDHQKPLVLACCLGDNFKASWFIYHLANIYHLLCSRHCSRTMWHSNEWNHQINPSIISTTVDFTFYISVISVSNDSNNFLAPYIFAFFNTLSVIIQA